MHTKKKVKTKKKKKMRTRAETKTRTRMRAVTKTHTKTNKKRKHKKDEEEKEEKKSKRKRRGKLILGCSETQCFPRAIACKYTKHQAKRSMRIFSSVEFGSKPRQLLEQFTNVCFAQGFQ